MRSCCRRPPDTATWPNGSDVSAASRTKAPVLALRSAGSASVPPPSPPSPSPSASSADAPFDSESQRREPQPHSLAVGGRSRQTIPSSQPYLARVLGLTNASAPQCAGGAAALSASESSSASGSTRSACVGHTRSASHSRARGATITSVSLPSRAHPALAEGCGSMLSTLTRRQTPFEVQIGTTVSTLTICSWLSSCASSSDG